MGSRLTTDKRAHRMAAPPRSAHTPKEGASFPKIQTAKHETCLLSNRKTLFLPPVFVVVVVAYTVGTWFYQAFLLFERPACSVLLP